MCIGVHIWARACSSITRSAVWIEQPPRRRADRGGVLQIWMVVRSAPQHVCALAHQEHASAGRISAARSALGRAVPGCSLCGDHSHRRLSIICGGRRVPAYCYSTCVHDERPVTIPASVRPVPGLPVDDLLASSHELARQWALALIAQLPLERIDEVPLDDLARGAPALCAQTLRALTSDADLSRLTGESTDTRGGPAPALELARISGADGPAGVTRAVEALRGVLWGALTIEMAGAHGRDLADTCDRLAHVCSCALEAVLRSRTRPAAASGDPASGPAAVEDTRGETRVVSTPLAGGVQIIDEHSEERAAEVPVAPPGGSGEDGLEIEIRDQRSRPGPSAWIDTIARRLEVFSRDSRPFSVLLVEPMDPAVLRGVAGARRRGGALRRARDGARGRALGCGAAALGDPCAHARVAGQVVGSERRAGPCGSRCARSTARARGVRGPGRPRAAAAGCGGHRGVPGRRV